MSNGGRGKIDVNLLSTPLLRPLGEGESLRAHTWKRFLSGPDPELLEELYVPALRAAERYDRCCAYFSSSVLAAAARGFAGLIERLRALDDDAPRPAIRLLVNEELDRADVDALLETGASAALEARLLEGLLTTRTALEQERLGMLAWLAREGLLEARVGVMRNGLGILHAKFGIITDGQGDALAFSGSGNETASGLRANYEMLELSESWRDPERHAQLSAQFETLWADQHPEVHTVPLPEAVHQELVRYAQTRSSEPVVASLDAQRAAMIWQFVAEAPWLANGEAACDATALVELWPHQRHVVAESAQAWPDGRLLCDEVGLGKTVEAILILRRLLAGRGVQRALLLVPAGLLQQWQAELREKGGLLVPRLENGVRLVWPDGREQRVASLAEALEQPLLLMSRELARLSDHQPTLMAARPWDLVLLDEAHAARRKQQVEGEFNSATLLLDLLRNLQLRRQARGILLLSATPMQTQPWEPWDLLAVLGEGGHWLADFSTVRSFYTAIAQLPSMPLNSATAQAVANTVEDDALFPPLPGVASAQLLRQRLSYGTPGDRSSLSRALKAGAPLARRMHRNTRQTLAGYHRLGLLDTAPARRVIDDQRFDFATTAERDTYDAIERYIDRRFSELEAEKPGKGFVMTVYRRRATSSFAALRRSLERRADGLRSVANRRAYDEYLSSSEDIELDLLDDLGDDFSEGKISSALPTDSKKAQSELRDVEQLLGRLEAMGDQDSKLDRFYEVIGGLLSDDHAVLVFTEYTDTMAYLRDRLQPHYGDRLACYSGDGGQTWDGERWEAVTKADITDELAAGRIRVLLCTDAASEGLNLQAASALINYDLPWNPSKVEQRIGRIDRIGQRRAEVIVVNLFLKDSIDDRVYAVLRNRCGVFQRFVGRMQPVLARARRMLLGQTRFDPSDLEDAAQHVEGDRMISEAYSETEATADRQLVAPLTRADLLAALDYLTADTTIRTRQHGDDGFVTIVDGEVSTRIGTTEEALERDPTATPLAPFNGAIERIARRLNSIPDTLPLVVGSASSGAFRATTLRWVDGATVRSVDSFADIRILVDGWDGVVPSGDTRLRAFHDAQAESRERVVAMQRTAQEREQAGLDRQVRAAQLRLLRELSRYLLVMGANPDDLNGRWHQLMQTRDSSVGSRLRDCYDKLGGWPEWDQGLVDDSIEVVQRLSEPQRKVRVTGSEIDAALADPRWRAAGIVS